MVTLRLKKCVAKFHSGDVYRRRRLQMKYICSMALFIVALCYSCAELAFAQTPFLSFPMQGYTPSTASISSVFDHSMTTPYSKNKKVIAYTGQTGDRNPDWLCYAQQNGQPFIVNGNYTGRRCINPEDAIELPFQTEQNFHLGC